MALRADIEKLISIHTRRLQILKEKKALKGSSVEPSIILEIEDTEAEIEELQEKLENFEEVASESITSQNVSNFRQEPEKESIPSVPIMQYDEFNKPDVSTIVAKYMQSTTDMALHKGAFFFPGPFRRSLRKALHAGKKFRILLCQNHPVVNHQLWFRSEKHWREENGADIIGSQIETGLRNIDAMRRHLTEKESRCLKVRLIPYVIPDPFCVIDRDRDNGLVLMYIRNFREAGLDAPFLIFRRSSEHNELYDFFVGEFERLWEVASPYSG